MIAQEPGSPWIHYLGLYNYMIIKKKIYKKGKAKLLGLLGSRGLVGLFFFFFAWPLE